MRVSWAHGLPLSSILLGALLAVALVVPIVAYAAFTTSAIESDELARLQRDREVTARLTARVALEQVQLDASDLVRFAMDRDVVALARARDADGLETLLQRFSNPRQFDWMGIVAGDGEIVAREPAGAVDPTLARDIAAAARGVASGPERPGGWALVLSDGRVPFRDYAAGALVVPIAASTEPLAVYGVFSRCGSGFVGCARWYAELGSIALPEGRSIAVIDALGHIVSGEDSAALPWVMSYSTSFTGHSAVSPTLTVPGLERALSGDIATERVTVDGEDRLATHITVIPGQWAVYVFDTPSVILAGERRLTSQMTTMAAAAVSVALALALLLAVLVARVRRQAVALARLAVSDERLRFARDLHDLLGHSLSLIAIKTELAGRLVSVDPPRAVREIGDVERVARDALVDVREAVAGYRQPTLTRELVEARAALDAAGIEFRVEDTGADLPARVDALFAWAVREGVTNVVRHSRATHCAIRIVLSEHEVQLDITDDGIGAVSVAGGSGLRGVAERATAAAASRRRVRSPAAASVSASRSRWRRHDPRAARGGPGHGAWRAAGAPLPRARPGGRRRRRTWRRGRRGGAPDAARRGSPRHRDAGEGRDRGRTRAARALSRVHLDHPHDVRPAGVSTTCDGERRRRVPAEGRSGA